MAAKRNPELDREAQQWVEAVIGEQFPSGTYEDVLKDGVILCKYVFLLFYPRSTLQKSLD